MSEEQTQNTESAASEASSQEASSEVTSAAETNDTTTNTEQVTAKETQPAWEYKGDRKSVPKEFQSYAKGFDRYVSQKDQALAEANRKIQEYESKLASSKQPEKVQEAAVSQDEMDAIALGDSKTLESVLDRLVEKRFEAKVTPIEKKQKELEAHESIKSFSSAHPDFQELLDSPAGEFMVDAARRGASLEQIYQIASDARDHFTQKAEEKRQANLQAKKAGSVTGKSITGTPDVVYVENADEQRRKALELTMKGDKRQVHIRQKK